MPAPDERLPEVERQQAQLFDWEQLSDYFGYVKSAVKRHKWLVLGTFLTTAFLGLAAAKLLPRTWYAETKLLPRRASTIAALVNPERANLLNPDPPNPMRPANEVDAPTKAAAEAVLRRDNLVALVKKLNLLDRWEATRPPLLRFKDTVMRMLTSPPDEEARMDGMVGVLEKKLSVGTNDGKVTIGVEWGDPQLAFELVDAAQQSFLQAREREEVSSIDDAITILEEHERQAADAVKESYDEFEKTFSAIMLERRRVVGDPRLIPRFSSTDQELAQLRFLIRAKRRAIADAQVQHNQRLTEMQDDLAQKREMYAPDHPAVVELEGRVASLRQGSPQVKALLTEEKDMLAEYADLGGKSLPFPDEPVPDPYGLERVLMGLLPAISENPSAAVTLEQLRSRQSAQQQILKRIDSAKLERNIAMRSFKYRFTLLTPAEFPRKPIKPNALVISLGAVVAGLVLGVFAALARDVLSGRVLESWQVERGLGLPVLAELDRGPGGV
ncbi:chain-length determining protein [Stigmatella sp. ncwal1]|uniref:Chain-length determining protein n=1 Tax=Stigmatella ashevillensis TaxID=2995309 RepID=A0ABT5DC19_9BACT|nr:chain-length determining protein [Stigmatella ashevillena]MDC0711217.1 chain-length determining protein [Stigmatella ashevillena]